MAGGFIGSTNSSTVENDPNKKKMVANLCTNTGTITATNTFYTDSTKTIQGKDNSGEGTYDAQNGWLQVYALYREYKNK